MSTLKKVADNLAAKLTGPDDEAAKGVDVLRAIAHAVKGYHDPAEEVRMMAQSVRTGGDYLAKVDTVVTAESFDRTARLLDAIAAALSD